LRRLLLIGFAVVALLGLWAVGRQSPAPTARPPRPGGGVVAVHSAPAAQVRTTTQGPAAPRRPPLLARRSTSSPGSTMRITLDGIAVPPEGVRLHAESGDAKDVRVLAQELFGKSGLLVQITGNLDGGGTSTTEIDLAELTGLDDVSVEPDERGSYTVRRRHLYRTDDDEDLWGEVYRLERVNELRFSHRE
jgi:hypothetical protein